MSEYFPESKSLRGRVKIELDLPNYVRSWYIIFAKKTNLANLKADVDQLDSDKLKNVSTNL